MEKYKTLILHMIVSVVSLAALSALFAMDVALSLPDYPLNTPLEFHLFN